jgi:predicted small lipoprotein YifL
VLAVGVAVAGMTLTGQAAAGCGTYGPIILPAPADDAGQLPEATGFLKTL